MAEDLPRFSNQRERISRRSALTSLIGFSSLAFLPAPSFAGDFEDPPVFENARHQFTMIEPPQQMPAITLKDRKGRPARLAAPFGKVLLLNFWATWCAACQHDLPLLERVHRVMGDRVRVAAVSTDAVQEQEKIGPYLDRLSIDSLPIYLDPDGLLASSSTRSNASFSLSSGMPVTYLITPSGRVAGYILGIADWMSADGQRLLSYYATG